MSFVRTGRKVATYTRMSPVRAARTQTTRPVGGTTRGTIMSGARPSASEAILARKQDIATGKVSARETALPSTVGQMATAAGIPVAQVSRMTQAQLQSKIAETSALRAKRKEGQSERTKLHQQANFGAPKQREAAEARLKVLNSTVMKKSRLG